MKKVLDLFVEKLFFVIIAFIIQISITVVVFNWFSEYFAFFHIFCIFLSTVTLLSLISKNINPAYKIAWIIPIMLFPIFGWFIYALFSNDKINKINIKTMGEIQTYVDKLLNQNETTFAQLDKQNIVACNQARYIKDYAKFPIYKNGTCEYYSIGEDYHKALLEELEKAEKFIFIEYFIIEEGKMWNSILDILKRKVKNGVEVRVTYDFLGCLFTLPSKYDEILENYGIKCVAFNPMKFAVDIRYNNRTHRKIVVIDGKTAFTGGINIADEYINEIVRFGHWKDTGIMFRGEAVWNFTVMFLTFWNFTSSGVEDYTKYKVEQSDYDYDGFIVPFTDSPIDNEEVGETIYMNLINSAQRYVYINTPYLIIDNEMTMSLISAAKRGVDVRIVTPHIPDKKVVFEVTRSNYEVLVYSGVKIFEYEPGFIHAKSFVVDDEYAVVGTINLDYRSLYLHFECGVWIYNSKVIFDIKDDYIKTLEKCIEYTEDDCKKIGKVKRLYRAVLKVFAPLM